MALIPEDNATPEDMILWAQLKDQLAKIRAQEMLLRQKIYKTYFKTPKEGTNKFDLSQGYVLKAQRVIDRKIELPVLQAMAGVDGPFHKAGINANDLVSWEPKLAIREYRELTQEQLGIFDQCLIIKDGSPSLEIVLPAAAKKAQDAALAAAGVPTAPSI